jgi:hypothetical protein
LPYPGPFTLFDTADPNDLGQHAYDEQHGDSETKRGIIYTCRGGFIDIAHVRKSADMCKYVAVRAEMALLNDWSAFRVKSLEPSIFIVRLDYPPYWKSLSPTEKKMLARELSIRIAQRTAMVIMTWHEVITWFGYQSSPIASERQSAFTWDDTGAHAFGITVAGRALHDSIHGWDQAMTREINIALRELGAATPNQTMFAVNRVRGLWWSGFDPLKRQIDMGWDGRPIEPWLVRGLPFCRSVTPYHYELPRLDNVMGRNFAHLLRIEIEPHIMATGKIRRVIPGKPDVVDVDKHLPIILDYIRSWHVRHEGQQVLRPY